MIFFGSRGKTIPGKVIRGIQCPSCKNKRFNTFGILRYFHVYWIPTFLTLKTVGIECTHCKKTLIDKELPVKLREKIKPTIFNMKNTVPMFSGSIIFACFMLFCFFVALLDNTQVSAYGEQQTYPDKKHSISRGNEFEGEGRDSSRENSDRHDKRSKEYNKNKVIKLSGVIDSIALAGGGRYLAFGMDGESSVELLDLQQQKLMSLDLHSDELTLVAGDLEYVYVAGADSGQLIQWSLSEKSVVQTGFSPGGATISAIASGWNAQNNMLFIITHKKFEILDTENFKPKKFTWTSDQYGGDRRPYAGHEGSYMARASGDGKIFTFWGTKHSPAGVNVLRIRGEKVIHYNVHDTAGFVISDRNGDRIYTGFKGAYTRKLNKLNLDYLEGGHLIPGIRGDYLLKVHYERKVCADLIRIADEEIIDTLDIPDLKGDGHPYSYHRKIPTGDQRFWLSEDNNRLFVIPDSNDRVVIYKLEI